MAFSFLTFYAAAADVTTTQPLPAPKTYGNEDFEAQTVGSAYSNSGSPHFGHADGSDFTKTIKQENSNKYYSIEMAKNAYYRLYPRGCDTMTSYVLSGDVRIETKNTSGYYGIYFAPKLSAPADNTISLLSWANGNGGTQIYDGRHYSDYHNDFSRNVWYSFEYIRIGENVCFRLWEKGTTKPAEATYTRTVPAEGACPVLRIKSDGVTGTVSVDNLSMTELPELSLVGAQVSSAVDANGQYAVRFLATVNHTDYAKAGFTIVATPTGGTAKSFTFDTYTVYSSVLGADAMGMSKTYTASALGGRYLIAAAITEIPATLGKITFSVTPFCESADGTRYVGTTGTFTLDMSTTSGS